VSDFITPATIKRVLIGAKFDIRALKPQKPHQQFRQIGSL
jgi:hypothetical protein